MPGVLRASIFVFAFTFGAVEIPLLLGQSFPSVMSVLAFKSYANPDLNARGEAMAMSMIITVMVGILIYLYMKLTRTYLRQD
jgi:putative spermidine/putrescine transport system permease protein